MRLHNFDFGRKILFHPDQLARIKADERPFPITLEVELTNVCNHDCSFCFYAEHLAKSNAKLDTEMLLKRLREAYELGSRGVYFTGGGEPMAHPDFDEIVLATRDIGFDVGLMTNGSLIRRKNVEALVQHLNWIRVSMGGGTRESYRDIQGRDHFERVIRNLSQLSDAKRAALNEMNIGVRAFLCEENLTHLVVLAERIRPLAIDYLQVAPDHLRPDITKFWKQTNTQKALSQLTKALEQTSIKLLTASWTNSDRDIQRPRSCYAHFFKIALTAEGNVTFCNMGRGHENFYLGNIYENSFRQIWDSPRNRELERRVRPSNCGLFCKGLMINLAVEETLHPDADMTPNFF